MNADWKDSVRPKYIAIANIGHWDQGKTTTIKKVFKLLSAKYPSMIIEKGSDIKATVQINDILIGVESQGDPNSRQAKSLKDFVKMGCQIILCACRSRGETRQNVQNLSDKDDYYLIWAPNVRPDEGLEALRKGWNELYAENMATFIEDYALG